MENISKDLLEKLVRQIIEEKLAGVSGSSDTVDFVRTKDKSGIMSVKLPTVKVDESNRMDTGKAGDVVYTKDLFTVEESPRLGAGIMEMKETTFTWTLNYDEVGYVIEGHLNILIDGRTIEVGPGEVYLVPKGSTIEFSVPDYARYLYVTYPADWADQA